MVGVLCICVRPPLFEQLQDAFTYDTEIFGNPFVRLSPPNAQSASTGERHHFQLFAGTAVTNAQRIGHGPAKFALANALFSKSLHGNQFKPLLHVSKRESEICCHMIATLTV